MFATFPGSFSWIKIKFLSLTSWVEIFASVYGFGPGISGLAYIGLGVGFFVSTFFGGYFGDRVYQAVSTCFHSFLVIPMLRSSNADDQKEWRQGQSWDADSCLNFWISVRPDRSFVSTLQPINVGVARSSDNLVVGTGGQPKQERTGYCPFSGRVSTASVWWQPSAFSGFVR